MAVAQLRDGSQPLRARPLQVPDRKQAVHSSVEPKYSPARDSGWGTGSGTAQNC